MLMKLDVESDCKLCEDLREILFSLMTSLALEDPMKWIHLCSTGGVSGGERASASTGDSGDKGGGEERGGGGGGDVDEDAAKFTTGESEEAQLSTKIAPRWPSKVFAVQCSRKIYALCRSDPAHFDLSLARKKKKETGGKG